MEITRYKHQIVIVFLLAGASLCISRMRDVCLEETLGISVPLPEQLGPFSSDIPLFCQTETCMRVSVHPTADSNKTCPSCGGALDPISLAEANVLPADTRLFKRIYKADDTPTFHVSVALAGKNRRSIHRPQNCLPAQGYRIDRSQSVSMPLEGGEDLNIRVLHIHRIIHTKEGAQAAAPGLYAYWYAGPSRDTSSQMKFFFLLAQARLLRNTAERWALVSVSTPIQETEESSLQQLSTFVARLHEAITLPRRTQPASEK